ncbi:MerC domain-containing protein [Actimicrobium antarcticum]
MVGIADYFGMTASILCLLHCLGAPLLLSLFLMLGLGQQSQVFHQYLVVLVTLPVLLALIPGFVTHRRWQVLVLGGLGLLYFSVAVLLIGPLFGEVAEIVLAAFGGAHLFTAHFKNRSFCRICTAQRKHAICSVNTCNSVAKKGSYGH